MYTIDNNNLYAYSDPALVSAIGNSLRRMRLNQNISQQQLADAAGLDRITISKLEHGRAATLLTVVQVLRALQRLDVLGSLLNEPEAMPGLVMEQQAQYRRRASHKRNSGNTPESEW